MIGGNPRLPLVGDRWSDSAPQVKTKPKIKTFLRSEKQQKLAASGASRWSGSGLRNSLGKETQRPIDSPPASGSSFNEKML
jgi:hypothetical protein